MRRPAVPIAAVTTLLALLGGLALAGCGAGGHGSGGHRDADVAFARGMIPHHAQAVVMARMAATHSTDTQVLELAAAIEDAQAPEIATMSGWLRDWDEKVPATDGSMSSADTGGMAGMMSAAEMSGLQAARGADFDRRWLRLMIEHHTGAVQQAGTELADGTFGPARELARSIETSQRREIGRMRQLLQR